MVNLARSLKLEAIKQVFNLLFGFKPTIVDNDDYSEINFSNDQAEIIKTWIMKQINSEPGDIRFNINNILIPLAIKISWPYLAGCSLIGYILGKKL